MYWFPRSFWQQFPQLMFAVIPCLALGAIGVLATSSSRAGPVRIEVVDESGRALPCRIHLKDQEDRLQRAGTLPFWHDHFVCPGNVELNLPAGTYRYEIERGPEYQPRSGSFRTEASESNVVSVGLKRIADLAKLGWFSGELHVHRSLEDMPLLMQAEDLHVAPVITWWNNMNQWTDCELPKDPLFSSGGNCFYHVMAGEDEREGGALMYFNCNEPLTIAGSSREYPPPMEFVTEARNTGEVWIDIEKPFWWDVPVWLASGQADSIGLANNHMCRSRMYEDEAWGKPRPIDRLPPPRGNGYWSQEIYYHILNCGLRLPPSAGSASGVLANPVGYNRVYVHVNGNLTYAKWWQGLKEGRSFVTNGPLLICRANDQFPGHVFAAAEGEEIKINIAAWLATNDHVPAVEIIKNGQSERTVPLQAGFRQGCLGTIGFRKSGWFLVRAIADNKNTFRFASTAPYYVEIGSSKRSVSKRSAQFFLDWAKERAGRVGSKLNNPTKLREVLVHHDRAVAFWREKVNSANVE